MANDVKSRPAPENGSAKLGDKPQGQAARQKSHEKPMSELATHQGGGGVNKDHTPHGGGPIPQGPRLASLGLVMRGLDPRIHARMAGSRLAGHGLYSASPRNGSRV